LADLKSGRLELVDLKEAIRLAPRFSSDRIRKRAKSGKIRWLKLSGGLARYNKADILNLNNRPAFYTTDETCRIIGVRRWATINNMFVKTGMLETREDPEWAGRPVVAPEALVAFLHHLLPDGDPQDWIDERMEDPDWPLRTRDAATYLGKTMPQMRQLVSDWLPFIWGPSKTERLFPVDELVRQIEIEPVTHETVAHAFGVTRQAVDIWRANGHTICTAHRHTKTDIDEEGEIAQSPIMYRACLIALLRRCLSPGLEAGIWLNNREYTRRGLTTLDEASVKLGISRQDLIDAAISGEIGGVHTPTSKPTWRFSPARIERIAQQQRRNQKR
jgi:hypothetical protein